MITHSHADHHMGIAALVAYRNKVLPDADVISVILPSKVKVLRH